MITNLSLPKEPVKSVTTTVRESKKAEGKFPTKLMKSLIEVDHPNRQW